MMLMLPVLLRRVLLKPARSPVRRVLRRALWRALRRALWRALRRALWRPMWSYLRFQPRERLQVY